MKVPRHEEWANTATHAVGLIGSVVAAPLLVQRALGSSDPAALLAALIFGLSLIFLYGASSAYHFLDHPRGKAWLQVVDHACIFLLIAGSYTPFALLVFPGAWGQGFLIAAWGFAVCGILFKLFFTGRFPLLSNLLYLGMGWMAVIGWRPLTENLAEGGVFLVLAGGAAYTLGVLFFIFDRKVPFFHAVWHLFVLAGSALHFLAIYRHVLPGGGSGA